MNYLNELINKINNKQVHVGVIGAGYVGSAIAQAAAQHGYHTFVFDIDQSKIEKVNQQQKQNLMGTDEWGLLPACDVICICVPTPLYKNKKPNFSIVKQVAKKISEHLRPGQLIIVESSLSVGVARNSLLKILKKSKLTPDEDFFFSVSPERIDPGNDQYQITNIPKIVSGVGKNSLKAITAFYSQFVQEIVPVSSLETAELTKLLENTFRFVNISLINEITDFAKEYDVNINEVVNAAKTKPFGFLAHYPSGGIGGYCIPVLPYFLLNNEKTKSNSLKIVEAAAKVNESRPKQVIKEGIRLLNGKFKKTKQQARSKTSQQTNQSYQAVFHDVRSDLLSSNGDNDLNVLLIGVSYKTGTDETRESVALKIWELAEKLGANVSYHDPYVPSVNNKSSLPLENEVISKQDLIIITTPHKEIDYEVILNSQKPIIDTTYLVKKSDET